MSSQQERSLRHRHPLPPRQSQRPTQPHQRHVFDIMYQNYTPSNIGGSITPRPSLRTNNNIVPAINATNHNQHHNNSNNSNVERVSEHTQESSTTTTNSSTTVTTADNSMNYTKHDPPGRRWSRDHVLTELPTPASTKQTPPPQSTTTTPPPQQKVPESNNNKPNADISPAMRPDLSVLLNNPKPIDNPKPDHNHSQNHSTTTVPVPEYKDNENTISTLNNVMVIDEQEGIVPTNASSDIVTTTATITSVPPQVPTATPNNNSNNTNVVSDSNNRQVDKENTPTVADPIATAKFLTSIRKEFWSCPDVYDSFVDIMRSARMQNIPLSEAVSRVQKILHGKQQLIEAFNHLLPADYHITDTSGENRRIRRSSSPSIMGTPGPAPITSAFHFISLIKTRFAEKPEVYQKFTQLLESYSCKKISHVMIHNEVRYLLLEEPQLLAEFNKFMPLPAQPAVLGRRQSNDRESVVTQQSKKHKVHRGDKKLRVGWETSPVFERIKIFLGNDTTYGDFVKLIGLYNQGALDMGTMVRVASEYIKSDETLLKEFKSFIGYIEIQDVSETKSVAELESVRSGSVGVNDRASVSEEQHPLSSIRRSVEPSRKGFRTRQSSVSTQKSFRSKSASVQTASTRRITLYELATRRGSGRNPTGPFDNDTQCASSLSGNNTNSEYGPGPSYRKIPKSGQRTTCSGRDNLCNEALNDEYASHPIWASEDGGFVASKKNQYEEALHRAEDERYFEDRIIDSGVSTIGLLNMIQSTLDSLPASQVSNYRPPKYLGGGTEMVYKPALTKIYDKKQVNEIIHLLHTSPAQTVPTVLKKVTTKVEEWKQKKVHADKNRKVAEIENFYKALDSQSNTFKQIDKKGLSIKSLVSEIEALSFEQHEKDTKHNRNHQSQMCYEFKDLDIINDIIRLLEVHNKHRVIYSGAVTEAMDQFYSTFFLPIMKVEGFEPLVSEDPDMLPCTADGVFLAYERLEMAKTISQKYSIDPKKTKDENTAQIDITINKVRHHGIELDFRNGCYAIVMTLIERLLKGEMDQSTYEACTRYMFGLKAYKLFTFDKLLASISNQVYMTVTEPDYKSYFDMYLQEETRVPEENISSLQLYKLKAESIRKGNENQYMILSTVGAAGGTTLSLSLIGLEDDDKDFEDYKDYVTEFKDWDKESPSVDRSNLKLPFLRRNVKRTQQIRPNMDYILEAGHEYKMCQNTYKLFYILGKEDYLQNRR
ncbi:hypothetical protein BDA99DRAFT_553973 [Phascolomyces articulosus]|uniref:Histone deacetylase interacting domain-containing protein n=1 Tax=Phascolomyces articulosus TaxID=60185 RepID=A0AAD5PK69_9FUNG|nr:hypothetical protein BDA99DRAFT_553973 [Phascolomyces articulosus]